MLKLPRRCPTSSKTASASCGWHGRSLAARPAAPGSWAPMPAVDLQARARSNAFCRSAGARRGLPTSLARRSTRRRPRGGDTELISKNTPRRGPPHPGQPAFPPQSCTWRSSAARHFSIRANHERLLQRSGCRRDAFHYLAPEFQEQPILRKEDRRIASRWPCWSSSCCNFGIHPYGIPTSDDVPRRHSRPYRPHCYAYGCDPAPGAGGRAPAATLAMPMGHPVDVRPGLRTTRGRARPPAQEWSTWLQFFAIPANSCVVVSRRTPGTIIWRVCLVAACARAPAPPAAPVDIETPPKKPFLRRETSEPPLAKPNGVPPAIVSPRQDARICLPTVGRAAQSLLATKVASLAALSLAVGIGAVVLDSRARKRGMRIRPCTPHPETADAPAPPAPDPYLAGNPDQQQSEVTDGYVTAATARPSPRTSARMATRVHTPAHGCPAHAPCPAERIPAGVAAFSADLSTAT